MFDGEWLSPEGLKVPLATIATVQESLGKIYHDSASTEREPWQTAEYKVALTCCKVALYLIDPGNLDNIVKVLKQATPVATEVGPCKKCSC